MPPKDSEMPPKDSRLICNAKIDRPVLFAYVYKGLILSDIL